MITLRKERRIYHRIAAETGLSKSTVGRILTRHGLNRWRDLEPGISDPEGGFPSAPAVLRYDGPTAHRAPNR